MVECYDCGRNCFIRSSGYCALHDEERKRRYRELEIKRLQTKNRNLKRKLAEYEKTDEEILAELAEWADQEAEREQERERKLNAEREEQWKAKIAGLRKDIDDLERSLAKKL